MTRRYGLWLDLWEPIQNLLPGRFGTLGRTLWTTASLWKQFYIDIEPEFLGETYHKDLGTSPWSIPVLVVGAALGS